MRGIYGKPYLDLDTLLPLHLLDLEGIELELATSERYHNLWGHSDKRDFSFYRNPPEGSSDRVKKFYAQHQKNQHQVQLWAKLSLGVYSPSMAVRASNFTGDFSAMSQLTVDEANLWSPNYSVFPSVWQFIQNSQVFTSTGRVNFLIQEHQCEIPLHNDYPHPESNGRVGYKAAAEKEFLWINLRQNKGLFIYDTQTKLKHNILSKSAWFNSLDLHGGSANPWASWSLRIDGKFTQEFRNKLRDAYESN